MITFDDMGPAAQEALTRLTDSQRAFIKHMFEGCSQTEAYRRAYPENKSPSSCGTDLAKKADIQLVLEELRLLAAKEFAVDDQKIIGAYAELSFGDIRDMYDANGSLRPVRELPRHLANMVQAWDEEEIFAGQGADKIRIGTVKKVKLINRKDALDSLARTQGLFITEKRKPKEAAKVVRFPVPVSKDEWEKKNTKS